MDKETPNNNDYTLHHILSSAANNSSSSLAYRSIEVIEKKEFDFSRQCCFCGEDNSNDPRGYAGERCCSHCNMGGFGEPDLEYMAYENKDWSHT